MDTETKSSSNTGLYITIGIFVFVLIILIVGGIIIWIYPSAIGKTFGGGATGTTCVGATCTTCVGATCTTTSGFSFVSAVDQSTLSADSSGNLISTTDTTNYTPLIFQSLSDGDPGNIFSIVGGPSSTIGWILAGEAANNSLAQGTLSIGPLSTFQGVTNQHYHWDFESSRITSADQSNRVVANLTTSVVYAALSSRRGSKTIVWNQTS